MTELEFDRQKNRRIHELELEIEHVRNGDLLRSLEMQLRMVKRQKYIDCNIDYRFIVNNQQT